MRYCIAVLQSRFKVELHSKRVGTIFSEMQMKTRTVVILTELSPCKNLSECMELWSFWSLALGLRSFWSFWSVGASELRSFWELLGAFGSFWELLGALGLQSFGASELRSFGASELLELWGFGAVGLWGFGVFGAFEVLELWSCGAFGTFPLCSFRRFSAVAVQESFQRFEKRIFEGYLPPTRNVDDDDDNGDSACGPSLSKSPACQSTHNENAVRLRELRNINCVEGATVKQHFHFFVPRCCVL